MDEQKESHRAMILLNQLWGKFKIQSLRYQVVTLLVMVMTVFWLVIFYSSFIIWQLFTFVMTKVLLRVLEWYLARSN